MPTLDVGIHLRRRDISMSQQGLNDAEICPTRKQMRGERVADRMRPNWPMNARSLGVLSKQSPKCLTGHPPSLTR
jgi:hypothetical protein